MGAVGGGIVGGALGGTTGALIGAAAGGIFGYSAGRAMEERDRRQIAYALEANQPMRWENSDTGYQYEIEPRTTYVEGGRPCRQFRVLAEVNGQPQEMTGTACRQPDGSWKMLNS